MVNNFDPRRFQQQFNNYDFSLLMANIAKNRFLKNFKDQGFEGQKWKEVQRREPDKNAYKYPKKKGLSRRTKPILTMTGKLRKAVANSVANGRKQSNLSYKIIVNSDYAERHNEGLKGMPKRQFIGASPQLQKQIQDAMFKEIKRLWENS